MESSQEFVINPITGRKIKVGSASHVKLMRDLNKMNSANEDLTGLGVKLKPTKKEPTTIRIYDHNDEDEYASSANEDAVNNLIEQHKVPKQKKPKESAPMPEQPKEAEPAPEPVQTQEPPAPEPNKKKNKTTPKPPTPPPSESDSSYESSAESEHDDYVESSESDTDDEFIGLIESFM